MFEKELAKAAISNDTKRMKELVSQGANIDTALEHAMFNNNTPLIKYLISKGANVHNKDTIYWAVNTGNLAVLKHIVDKLGGITFGPSMMDQAISYGHINIVKYLASKKAGFNPTALQNAVSTGKLPIVKYLVDNNIRDDKALLVAIFQKRWKIAEYLASVGIGNTEAFYQAASNYKWKIVKYLIPFVDIHVNNEHALMEAIMDGKLDIVKELVSRGADIHINDNEAFEIAKDHKKNKILEYLISVDKTANIFTKSTQSTKSTKSTKAKKPKVCNENQVLNPKTGRCNKKKKKSINRPSCPTGQVLRCVDE